MNILSHGQEYFPAFNIEGKVLISLNDFDFLRTEVFSRLLISSSYLYGFFFFFFSLPSLGCKRSLKKKKVLVSLSDFLVAASLCSEASMPINTV